MTTKRQKVKYAFLQYSNNTTGITQQTLVLEQPAEVRFYNISASGGAGKIIINNIYELTSPVTLPASPLPTELVLKNNLNEIDVTTYQLRLNPTAILNVVVKYYVDYN
jgi:hypothetical protein